MRAIISTAKRDGLTELARELKSHDITIFSTSGTAGALSEAGIEAEPVSALTRFPEILDGRVKTLHPAVYGGILARRDNIIHTRELQEHGICGLTRLIALLFFVGKALSFPRHGSCDTLVVSRTREEEKHDKTTLEGNLLSLSWGV